ncbi:hypothetical protein [Streptomyces capitiformicae]|uniref:Uncharacterized protein n=1 Tax=Streptomyces capitiformicae TaxID=2014920 RepID=A0A918ZM31_9ACTN|nr:hypothetical protein [Streptomyces capitiformicae]GHE58524.1 hypothetical protein GCM10017771_81520 [Streptomyces capitiformicae]
MATPLDEYEEAEDRYIAAATGRALAVEHWLLSAADDSSWARSEWRESGVALLRCGTLFGVIRISGEVVRAAAGTEDPYGVDAFLARAMLGGPVFTDTVTRRYYVMVSPSTGSRSEWTRRSDKDAEYLGRSHYLGVPSVHATSPDGPRAYWCVPMAGAGELASAEAVSQLLSVGRYRLACTEEASC